MSKMVDLTGRKFGRLTVVSYKGRDEKGGTVWNCLCECGKGKSLKYHNLTAGNTKSCSCLRAERVQKLNETHGLSRHRLYHIWSGMKQRCYNPKMIVYSAYGGRGISICDDWLNDFMSFYSWAYANGYRDDLTIERKNVDGNYEPDNCTWIPQTDQYNNMQRNKGDDNPLRYPNDAARIAAWQKANTDNFSMNIKCTDKINKPLLFEATKAMGPGMSVSKILLEGAKMYISARLGAGWIEERGGSQ